MQDPKVKKYRKFNNTKPHIMTKPNWMTRSHPGIKPLTTTKPIKKVRRQNLRRANRNPQHEQQMSLTGKNELNIHTKKIIITPETQDVKTVKQFAKSPPTNWVINQ